MSSLRNAVQRRNHRERAQPAERAKWGILEKHKDYKLRAADHNAKKRKIKTLKEKAATRNEDEFYFAMMNLSSQGGIKQARRGEENSGGGGKSLDTDVVKLLKTQDQGYLRTMLQKTKKDRERAEQELAIQDTGVNAMPNSRRIVFDEEGEIKVAPSRLESYEDEDDDDDDELDDLDALGDLDDLVLPDGDASFLEDEGTESAEQDSGEDEGLTLEEVYAKRRKQRSLHVKRRRLAALQDQERKLGLALNRLDDQRAKMNGTIGGINKNGIQFKVKHRKR